MLVNYRKHIIFIFLLLGIVCLFLLPRLKFSFSFEQFFPKNDPDLKFYKEFIEEFEADNNFLLVGIKAEEGVFQAPFLEKFHQFGLEVRGLPHVIRTASITQFNYPIKTPFGWTTKQVLRWKNPEKLEKDKKNIMMDERYVGQFVDEHASSAILQLKTEDFLGLRESDELITGLENLIQTYEFEEYHLLGSPYFQKELIEMEKRELFYSTLISLLLVSLIIYFLYRRKIIVAIVISSIGMGLLVFLGVLAILGRELNVLTAFYPVLMLIVGTSDVIHIMTKYLDELRNGLSKKEAIRITMRQIGMATLLTSLTTAAGFLSLTTSRLATIQEFGMNAAMGVILAFVVVFFFTSALLVSIDVEKLKSVYKRGIDTKPFLDRINRFTRLHPGRIALGAGAILLLCFWGISLISTNYKIEDQLPKRSKVKEDFSFFEKNYAGFRPIEFAVEAKNEFAIHDLEVLRNIEKLEAFLRNTPTLGQIVSINMIYKSIIQGMKSGQKSGFRLPENEREYREARRIFDRLDKQSFSILINKDETKTRISSKVLDIGADSIKVLGNEIDLWISQNLDSTIVSVTQTGTGLILDKNSIYVRDSLIRGLGLALFIVSLLMALLFRNVKMLIISLIPNVFPLLIAAAIIGFFGIELEAGITIIFAIAFGIAVDDTIHFLSKFKISRNEGKSIEESLDRTFQETGKAILFTSIILFFGFLIVLFSSYPPASYIGILISLTLLTAFLSDVYLLPVLIRKWLK